MAAALDDLESQVSPIGLDLLEGIRRCLPELPRPDLQDWAHAYYGTNYDRLRRIKAAYDPDSFFRFHQSLPQRLGDDATWPALIKV